MKTATTLAAMAVLLAGFSSTATADQAVDAPSIPTAPWSLGLPSSI